MSSNLPHFIQEHLVFVSDIHLSRKHRSKIVLLRSLQLYELHRKQILNSIDLQNTVLNKVQEKIELVSPVLDATQNSGNDVLGSSIRCSNIPVGDIILGKYIYQNRNLKMVYIILKCWDSLVIIKKTHEGFTLEKEYEGVESFDIVKSRNFESNLAISFLDSDRNVMTNLQNKLLTAAKPNTTAFRKAEDLIKIKQSELLVHKTITKKEFRRLKNSTVFGNNFLRTTQLEEARILSKCSDAWLKVSADDKIVIGVPLVNNSSVRLTTLRNLRGLLQCSGSGDLVYDFAIYQQSSSFSVMEDIKSIFETEPSHNFDWSQCTELLLRPETFYVLLFRISMKDLVEFNALELLLFVSFDVMYADKLFSQKCFLANLSFRDVFADDAYKISFRPNHLQRDLLSVIATSFQSEILLNYHRDDASFKEYLCKGLDFSTVSPPESLTETMNIDEWYEDESPPQAVFFYNSTPNSLWHGTLIAITKTSDDTSVSKIFTKTQEKSILFLRVLETELRVKCGIKEICCDYQDLGSKLVQFESLLRDECKSRLKLFFARTGDDDVKLDMKSVQALHRDVYLVELKTDLCLKKLKS